MTAKTLVNILKNPLVVAALDRSQPIKDVVKAVMDNWSIDMLSRHPSHKVLDSAEDPSLYDGTTNLDLFTILYSLARRKAVINIPNYENLRATTLTSDQTVVSRENRHGQLHRIESNAVSHAFSALITDYNVIVTRNGREVAGAPRNFALVDDFGKIYEGLELIEPNFSSEEEAFFREHGLEIYTEPIELKHFVHPNRYQSFLGSPYLISKILVERLKDEAEHYRKQDAQLESEGVKFFGSGMRNKEIIVHEPKGDEESVKVPNLEAMVWGPMLHGEYPIKGLEYHDNKPVITDFDTMPTGGRERASVRRYAEEISDALSYRYGPMVRAPVRAAELAFFLHGRYEGGTQKKPGWDIPKWDSTMLKNSHLTWNRLAIDPQVQLLYRIRESSIMVAR